MKILNIILCSIVFTVPAYSAEDNASGFQVSQMLSHKALSQDTEAYPKGKVIKTINVGSYTYFQFQNKEDLTWAAASTMELNKGDQVILMKSFPMLNFTSKTLEKTFDKILFVSQLDVIKKTN